MLQSISKEIIDITPDVSLLPKIGQTGYTLTQSIAELVDNSIDARTPDGILMIKVVLQNDFITVEDNASGMDKTTVTKALVLGHSIKKDALGEFGIGLKAACTSLGKKFSVETFQKGSSVGYLYEFDEDNWLSKQQKDDWTDELKVFKNDGVKAHGTKIKIESLKRRVSKARKKDLLKDFGDRFSPFLKTGEVKIFINNEECQTPELELIEGTKKNFNLKDSKGNKISGWYALMRQGSDRGLYGFTTFRHGRMITSYDKIGIYTHPTLSRITGEIYLDHVPVAHNKKEFEMESDEYKYADQLLREEFKDIVKQARQTFASAKITKEIQEQIDRWKAAIVQTINRSQKDLFNFDVEIKKRSQNTTDHFGQLVLEKRNSPMHENIRQIISKKNIVENPDVRDKL